MPSRQLESVERSVIEILPDATRSRHAQPGADPAMSSLFDPQTTVLKSRDHLRQLLGLLEPLEFAVACSADVRDPIPGLRRSNALRLDHGTMGEIENDIQSLERCYVLSSIDAGRLFGYAYMVQGPMIGGRIIAKRVRSVLGPAVSLHSHVDSDGRFGALWAPFGSEFAAHGEEKMEAICATAVRVSNVYASWFAEPNCQPGEC